MEQSNDSRFSFTNILGSVCVHEHMIVMMPICNLNMFCLFMWAYHTSFIFGIVCNEQRIVYIRVLAVAVAHKPTEITFEKIAWQEHYALYQTSV